MKTKRSASLPSIITCVALTAVCLISLACGSARRREPLATPAALDQRAERGRAVFMANCHQCHPGGEAGLGPAINDKPFPEFLKKFQVRHGLGTMPSFSEQKISDEQLEDLMEYLNALRRSRRTTAVARGPTRSVQREPFRSPLAAQTGARSVLAARHMTFDGVPHQFAIRSGRHCRTFTRQTEPLSHRFLSRRSTHFAPQRAQDSS